MKKCGVKEIPKQNLTKSTPYPETLEIPEKTSQSEPHPLDPRKSWKKPHNSTELLVVGWLVGWLVGWFRQAVQRPPAGANKRPPLEISFGIRGSIIPHRLFLSRKVNEFRSREYTNRQILSSCERSTTLLNLVFGPNDACID